MLSKNAIPVSVLTKAFPRHNSSALWSHGNSSAILTLVSEGVDLKFAALLCPRIVEILPKYPIITAILIITFPRDKEVALSINGNRGFILILSSRCVDGDFVTDSFPCTVVLLGKNPVAIAIKIIETFPGNHKFPIGIHGNVRSIVINPLRGTDHKAVAQRGSGTIKPTSVNGFNVGTVVFPGNHKIPAAINRHNGVILRAIGNVVDRNFISDRIPVTVVHLSKHAIGIAILT